MKIWRPVTVLFLGVSLACLASLPGQAQQAPAEIELTGEVDSVSDLLYARSFELVEPYLYAWLQEQPEITRGSILILELDPRFARPRQVDVAVLFVGDTPAHLTNIGYDSGRKIVIVPEWIDLAGSPSFFGSMELPERIDRRRGEREVEAALAMGIRPFPAARIAAAREVGGDTLRVTGSVELFRAIADLIDIYAPTESELAEIYRTPLVGE